MADHPALRTLGSFELDIGDCVAPPLPTHKARAIVAFLVANRGRDISRERMLELFWNGFEPQRAREGLRTALSSIRHALRTMKQDPDAILFANKSIVRWVLATDFDAERFVELAESEDLASLESAVQMYAGDFLEGGYEEWAVGERERLASVYENVLAKIVARNKNAQAARLLLERNPYNEDAYATLIEGELAAGRSTAAAELFKRYRAAMAQIGSEVSVVFEQRFAALADISTPAGEISVPFVARAEELQNLTRVFQEAAGQKGFAGLVIGEPGIGKTALLARANEKAREAGLRALTVRGSDDPRPLGAWRGLYQRLTGRDLDRLPGISALEITSAAAREMVEAFGRPTAVFVDDAQALTGDSFAIFAQTARIAQESGHAVIATLRPEARERVEAALSGLPYEIISLRPLERADVHAAIALAVDSSTPEFSDALYRRSGGNPLFLKSLLQSLVQGESVRQERGRWRVVRPLSDHLELPRDLRSSIEARLYAAGDDAAVVACALALEPSATAEDLAAALDYPEPRVLDALDELIRYGLLGDGDDGAQFAFVHDLLREVAASTLNQGRRVTLHRAFARRFESGEKAETALRLARHLRASGLNVPAAQAYLRAAQAALGRRAYRDALESSGEGARTVERVTPSRDINELLSALARIRAEASLHLGETALAKEAADEAVRQARASEDLIEIARALAGRAALHGSFANASAQLTDALEASETAGIAGDTRARARALVQAASAMLVNGATAESRELAREACDVARERDDYTILWDATAQLLKTHVYQWEFDVAAGLLKDASPVAERAGRSPQAEFYCIQAAYDYLTDRLTSATQYAQLAIGCEPSSPALLTAYYLQGIFARERGDTDGMFASVRQCRSLESIANLPQGATALSMLEADALLARGASGDRESASKIAASLADSTVTGGMIGWSDCPELTSACVQGTRASLRMALDALEENARRLLLDCDRAFARLSTAAAKSSERTIHDRAAERCAYYRARRVASAAKAGDEGNLLVSR